MKIANPIYDVVFKFMMEDKKVAKSFISAIIEEEIVELDFAAQERTRRVQKPKTDPNKENEEDSIDKPREESYITVCRFDFAAKISLPGGGFKTVMIELQKAKFSSDIMRFRRYLGLHYQNANNTYGGSENPKARQIYCIFLLGYDIGIPGRPVIQVDNSVKDGTTKENLPAHNEFIESLSHRSWIVQTDQLGHRRRNDVETLLGIFDQENRTENHHIMNVRENDFPEQYRPLIRRLHMASQDEDIQIEMEVEDDFLKELQNKDRVIIEKDRVIEEKDRALEEKDRVIEEKDKALEEKEAAIARERAEKEAAIAQERAEKEAAIIRERALLAELAALKGNR